MVRVYLDQNKWIDLARAAHGHRDGERFHEALECVRASVANGFAQYPLSLGDYFETWRQGNEGARRRLAVTMTEISRHVSIASPPARWVHELRRTGLLKDHGTRALRSVADLPAILGELCAA